MTEPIDYAKNRGHDLLARAEADLEAGRITEAEWHARGQAVITPAYLAGANPRAQSGHSGDEAHWRAARSHICDAIDVRAWAAESGFDVEPHGLDIAPELADLARRRLPQWAHRTHVGNVLHWAPPQRYDLVRTGLEYVPRRRHADLLRRLLADVVAPGGRLILGSFSEEVPDLLPGPSLEQQLGHWGFVVSGRTQRPHFHDERLLYKTIWLDA